MNATKSQAENHSNISNHAPGGFVRLFVRVKQDCESPSRATGAHLRPPIGSSTSAASP